jgi:hypothetical protein
MDVYARILCAQAARFNTVRPVTAVLFLPPNVKVCIRRAEHGGYTLVGRGRPSRSDLSIGDCFAQRRRRQDLGPGRGCPAGARRGADGPGESFLRGVRAGHRVCFSLDWGRRSFRRRAVAPCSHQGAPPSCARYEPASGHSHRPEPQGLLAPGENPGHPDRDDECLARKSRAALYPHSVDEGPWLCLSASRAPSSGTAPCGPACGVVWGGGAKHSPLPD